MKTLMAKLFFCMVVLSCLVLVPAGVFAADISTGVPSVAQANTPADDDDDDDGGGGCAAAYLLGEDDPRLGLLRELRDEVLSETEAGTAVIDLFYAQSDIAIEIFESSPVAKQAARKVLESILPAVELIVQ